MRCYIPRRSSSERNEGGTWLSSNDCLLHSTFSHLGAAAPAALAPPIEWAAKGGSALIRHGIENDEVKVKSGGDRSLFAFVPFPPAVYEFNRGASQSAMLPR